MHPADPVFNVVVVAQVLWLFHKTHILFRQTFEFHMCILFDKEKLSLNLGGYSQRMCNLNIMLAFEDNLLDESARGARIIHLLIGFPILYQQQLPTIVDIQKMVHKANSQILKLIAL